MFAVWVLGCGSPASDAGLEVVVDAQQLSHAGRAGHATMAVSGGEARIDVVIDELVHYCDPAPSFTVAGRGEELELMLTRPDGVSKCSGSYHVELHVTSVGEATRLVLRDPEGRELATAALPGSDGQ